MLGPEGAGIAYVSAAAIDRLRPMGVGWNSVVHAGDYSRHDLDLKPHAGRYEGGSYNMAGFLGLGASIELLASLGIENIASAVLDITDRACERLTEFGATVYSPRAETERSGIVCFELGEANVLRVRQHCLENGVAVACRGGRLRISAHAYNNEDDLDRLFDALRTAPG